jgi:predicted GIY-YIG superfamily endonuclease
VPANHLNGQGCPSCAGKIKLTTETFISKSIQKHGHIYDYSLVEYIKSNEKVKIICKEHGTFEQSPANHLGGSGCPSCAIYGFNPNKPAIFYILKFNDQDLWKIGITNKSVTERYSKKERELFNIVKVIKFKSGTDALQLETKLKRQYKEFLYTGVNTLDSGHTELFTYIPVIPFRQDTLLEAKVFYENIINISQSV